MRIVIASFFLLLMFTSCGSSQGDLDEFIEGAPKDTLKSDIWVSAYLAAWNHYAPPGGNWGFLSAGSIDWAAFTHLFYFALTVEADGSLSKIEKYHTFSPDRINTIVSAAHQNDTPVLFSVGGWGNYDDFSQAIRPAARSRFISNLVGVLEDWGFDGIDLDMEPIYDSDEENYKVFVTELHRRFQSKVTRRGYRPILTAATSWKPGLFAQLHEKFDQINLMTYDMSGAWGGWVSWHNAPVFDGGFLFPNTDRHVPSADAEVNEFISAGVPKEKLGIGIDFYGYVWSGYVIKPNQSWITPPVVEANVPYHQIMEQYYKPGRYRWDDIAKAAYLSIDHDLPREKKFISFDDEKSIEAKINYARAKGIGGVIIWELSGGYRQDQPPGKRDILLQKVKKELKFN